MHSTKLQRLSLILIVGLILSGVLACDLLGGGATKPTVTVSSPQSFTEVQVGAEVEVVSTVRDTKGVTKVELAVDGVLFSTEASPSPQGDTSWTLTQTWVATEPGVHNLTVTAYNVDGLASDPWGIAVKVVEGAEPGATGTVTLATSTPAAPGATATLPPPGSTATTAPPAPTRTTAAPPPTNTPVPPPPPTNTPVAPPPGQPDLAISELSVDPANPAYGASGVAYFTIRNHGTAPAGQSVLYFQWGPGGSEVGQAQVPALAAGAEHSLGANVGPFYSSFSVWGVIDAGSAVAESNEDNNRREFMVNVAAAALPDLTIVELSLNPWPYWGNESDARITVANVGSGGAGSFGLYYRWAEAEPSCEWRMDPLPAGAEVTVSCHVGPFWYPYTTSASADWGSEVTESNEDNNVEQLYVEAG